MNIEIARAIIDFGAVVLIWMVQLVVYPSFVYFAEEDLRKWHLVYTKHVSYIVAPIMFLQTGIIAFQFFLAFTWLNALSAIICLLLWGLTFFEAVPLHHKIDFEEKNKEAGEALVRINKKRTALWTVLFIISIYQLL